MAFQKEKDTAQQLRKKGKSIAEISQLLRKSESTVSFWCRSIQLTTTQINSLVARQRDAGAIGRVRAAQLKRTLRLTNIDKMARLGKSDVGTISQRDLFMIGLALYWGEGYKTGNDECGLTNSDPAIIITFIEWLKRNYSIPHSDLILRVSVNETHRHRVEKIEYFWSQETGIPLSQFTQTSLIKSQSRKVYTNAESHFGTLRVKVRRGTSLRRRIMGSLDILKNRPFK